jgi:hypothetical protein
VSGALELAVVALVVGGALAFVLSKSLRAAKQLAKGEAPSCCSDKDGYMDRAGSSSCPDADGAASGGGNDAADADGGPAGGSRAGSGGFVSPCAGCTGCAKRLRG